MTRLKRRLWGCALALGISGPLALAGPPQEKSGGVNVAARPADRKPGDVVTLRLVPKPEPLPAFRHRLLPGAGELRHGNAVPGYLRMMTPATLSRLQTEQERERIDTLLRAPLEEVRKQRDTAYPWLLGGQTVQQLDAAARASYADWNLEDLFRQHHLYTFLPELEDVRFLSRLLALRVRYHVAGGEWIEAIEALKTGFALARHLSHVPTLVSGFVAAGLTQLLLDQVEELIQQPGAPNLYWALSDLPDPLIDFRRAWQGERWFGELVLRQALDEQRPADTRPLGDEQAERVLGFLQEALRVTSRGGPGQPAAATPDLKALVAGSAARARAALQAYGVPSGTLQRFSDTQAVLAHAQLEYLTQFDRLRKSTYLPYPEGQQERQKIKNELGVGPSGDAAKLFTAQILPAVEKSLETDLRLRQRVAALRVLEALRLQAAAAGKWPTGLAEVTAVPVPDDPFTGRPFDYSRRDNAVVLTTDEKNRPVWINYRLELVPAR